METAGLKATSNGANDVKLKAIGINSSKDFLYMLLMLVGSIPLSILLWISVWMPWLKMPEKGSVDLTLISYPLGIIMAGMYLVWVLYAILGLILKPKTARGSFNGKFSILIAAKDEENVISALINEVLHQTYRDFEVIVVCHNCQDRTYEVASRFRDERVKVLEFVGKPGKSAALNYGVKYASGDIIVVLDADNHIPPDFLEKLSKYFPQYDAVQSLVETVNPNYNLLTKLADLEFAVFTRSFQRSRAALGLNAALSGTGEAVKRKVLEEVGYWDEWALTEDLALFTKLSLAGYKIGWCQETYVLDEKAPYWSIFARQRARWLRGHIQVAIRYVKSCWRSPGILHLLISPIFVILGFSLTITLWLTYLLQLPVSASFIPVYAWFIPWIIWDITAAIHILKTRGLKALWLLPAFLIYLYHWFPAATLMWKTKVWTKTSHGFIEQQTAKIRIKSQ